MIRYLHIVLALGVIIVLFTLWKKAYKKSIIAEEVHRQKEELERLNKELSSKQYQLEEQNALVEELNAQLSGEVEKYQWQKDMLQAIAFSVDEGIAMIDTSGELVFINKLWKTIFDYKFDKTARVDARDFLNHIKGNVKQIGGNLLDKEDLLKNYIDTYSAELEQCSPAHRYIKLHSMPCIAKNKQAIGRVFVCRDISHEKEIDKLKSELISTVSHELRTPMSSIMGFSELVLTRQLPPERSKKYIEIIHSESHRLTNLINDFLDIQRMESGKQEFNKQDISFGAILKESVGLFQHEDKNHKIVYDGSFEDGPSIYCDSEKVVQVMSNLISNAVKYSPKGGDIVIKTGIENNMLKVSVTDFGLGIPDEVKSKLFNKFFRVDNDDRREIGGTGLGLAICREIIHAHDGKIWVESKHGEGSTFYFTLPLSAEDLSEVAVTASVDENNMGTDAILIVEDDKSLVKLIEDVLRDEGFDTYTADSGEEALKLIDSIDFKMIILDINLMGKLNGWDVVKTLKDNSKTAGIPVVISSIYENKNSPMAGEVRDFLVKPFESGELLEVIHKIVSEDLQGEVQADEKLISCITNALESRGVKVREYKFTGNMLIITLDGEKQDEA